MCRCFHFSILTSNLEQQLEVEHAEKEAQERECTMTRKTARRARLSESSALSDNASWQLFIASFGLFATRRSFASNKSLATCRPLRTMTVAQEVLQIISCE
jgi:hypothetical protein